MPKSDHKRTSSKHKIDRRLGVNLWGRPKSPLNDREYAPGQHGQRRKKPTQKTPAGHLPHRKHRFRDCHGPQHANEHGL